MAARRASWRRGRTAARRSRGWPWPTASRTARASRSGSRPGCGPRPGCSRTSRPSTVARALGRLDERGEHPDGRRLARAVGPEQAEDLAATDLERHVADRPAVAEAPTQTGRVEGRGPGPSVTRAKSARAALRLPACPQPSTLPRSPATWSRASRSPAADPTRSGSSTPRAGSTSSASTPTTTRASSCPRRSTSASPSRSSRPTIVASR